MSDRSTRTVFVTGGVSGIGRAIAEAFVKEGSFVYVTARSQEEIERASPFCDDLTPIALDVTRPASVLDVIGGLQDGRLDVLVNAAGTILRNGQEFEPANFQHVVDVNLHGSMRMCMAA